MFAIILNHKYEDVGMFQNYAKPQYRTLGQIDRTIQGTLKIQRIAQRDEWRLLWSADQREIGRVRKVEPAPIEPEPRRASFREVAQNVAAVASAVFALFGIWR